LRAVPALSARSAPRLAALALCGALALPGCDANAPPEPAAGVEAPAPPPEAEPAVEVETARVRRGSILQRISAPGSIVARRESRIGPEVRGRIAKIHVREGDRVSAGDPLFEIDPEPYALGLRAAEARLDRAQAERRQLEADLARGDKLRRQQVVAEQRMEELHTSVQVARAAEREAEEALALAKLDLERCLVRAPYAASVAARLEDEGTTALAQPQTIVLVLQETSDLEAHATIPEVHFAAIQVGDPALLHVEGLPRPIASEVATVSDAIDPATRTYLVKMRVPNDDHALKAGVFARVEILPRAKSDVLLLPRDAVRREDGRTRVLAVRDGRAVAVPVTLGVVAEDAAEVLHGVRVDDEVVVGDAAHTLGPGMRVLARPRGPNGADSASAAP
jgi:RND family efflux transporter MFP subunit